MECLGPDIKKLAELIKDPDDPSSSDDDLPPSGLTKLGPGNIGGKKKSKVRVRGNEADPPEESTDMVVEDPDAIWSLDEVPEVPYSDDILSDPREKPEYGIVYKQAVTPEDIYLQMGNKTQTTASCEQMVLTITLTGEDKNFVDCHLREEHLDIRSPRYRLSLPLPHPVDPDTSAAEWDPDNETLKITMTLNREFDFVNF